MQWSDTLRMFSILVLVILLGVWQEVTDVLIYIFATNEVENVFLCYSRYTLFPLKFRVKMSFLWWVSGEQHSSKIKWSHTDSERLI